MIINLAKIRFGGSGGGTSPAKPEDFFQETYTANGNYDVTPQAGHVFSGGQIEVDVHPENSLSLTITESGSYTSSDEFSGYKINVDVEGPKPEETLTQTITENGTQTFTPTAGSVFDSAVITVNVPGITPTGTININANGTYDVTDKATAVVAVGGTDYRYKTGTPDTIGLAAIGWTADDIGYYGANTPHYAWQNDNYKVSQKNIDLYNLDDPKPDLYRDDPDVTFVPNKNILKYFGPGSGNTGFYSMPYIKSIPLFNTSAITSLNYWFKDCTSLQTIPPLNTSNVTDMGSMFKNCSSLTSIPQLNTSNVVDINNMFQRCSSLTSIPQLDTSKATSMSYMFQECSSLTSIPQLDTSKVTSMYSMFEECSSLRSIPQLDTSKVTSMESMFRRCSFLTSVSFTDTSKASRMNYIFYDCERLERIEGMDFSSVTSKPSSFFGYSELNRLTHFIVSGKINFSWNDNYGFHNAPNLDYDSVKSILEAMNRTDNTNAKEMKFNQVIVDRNGELAGLVSSCATKGWTITGLTVKEKSMINSITPSLDHIHISDLRGGRPGLTLTIDANEAWIGGGIPKGHTTTGSYIGYQYDFYDANTDELTRTGSSYQNITGMWVPDKGSIGITNITGHYSASDLTAPH